MPSREQANLPAKTPGRKVYWLLTMVGLVLVLVSCSTSKPSPTSSDSAAIVSRADSVTAVPATDEVCSDETRSNVARQLAAQPSASSLTKDPAKQKSGDRTSCTYEVDGGSMQLSVDQLTTNDAAERHFDDLRSGLGVTTVVPNLGASAFTSESGVTVTRKDDKVLVIDTSMLPVGNDKPQISQSLSFEILTCWTG